MKTFPEEIRHTPLTGVQPGERPAPGGLLFVASLALLIASAVSETRRCARGRVPMTPYMLPPRNQ
jgi:hypothetical protein